MKYGYSTKPYKMKRPSPMERTHRATLKLYVDYNNGVYVEKNKYGPTGKVDTRDLIDIICYILSEQAFDGKMKFFQEEMIEKSLKPAICKVLRKYKVLEGEENDKIQRASFSDGACM
jgi:hypothetical protein